ncbi:uncharacterized protein LOC133523872 [Cydia pomonella]|uniref:uncharacterized protein LOC133523872 n=1 Tax=Cydia pomonella TaxID=82600 RepID=UPI002ADE07B1|nr:uncharacterized protein LOC133523872 [Cydia pomonella]
MTGAMRTTPTHAMEVMLGLKPLWIEVEKRATEQWYRMKACKEWRGSCVDKRHALIQREALSRFEMLMANNDLIKRQEIFDKKYRVHIGERDNWKVEVRHPTTICFTDGSRRSSTKLAGAGIVIPKLGETVSIPLGRYASVFQAEVCAIAHCARIIKESVKQEGAVVIYTDSQAALKALKKISVTSALVRECREELNSIGKQRSVTVAWVPGHQGVTGNERADELARIGAETEYMGPEPALPMSADVTKGVIEKVKEMEAQREWEEETSCRQSKMMVKGIDHKRTRYLLKLGKSSLRILTGIITGHNTLNRHLKSDQRKVYRKWEETNPRASDTQPPDATAMTDFWRSIWSVPVGHTEGSWMSVVEHRPCRLSNNVRPSGSWFSITSAFQFPEHYSLAPLAIIPATDMAGPSPVQLRNGL